MEEMNQPASAADTLKQLPVSATPVETASTNLETTLIDTDILLMLYGKDKNGNFYNSITQEDEVGIYSLLKENTSGKKKLVIYLDTPGGSIYTAVKVMDMLREKYDQIDIAVAQEAKSSGTLMCLAADSVIMSAISELGPLDKPMPHPDNEMATISALDIVRSLDNIIDTAIDKQKTLATQLTSDFRVNREKALEIAGEMVAKLMSPLICKEDTKIYNEARRLLTIAELYGKELLMRHMLKYIKQESLRERIANIMMEKLVWLYPDHNFAIRREDLKDNFFNIQNGEDLEYIGELWDSQFVRTIGKNSKTIKFL